jgi:threonine/homoserine/homoserine lactone efflux protein
MAFGFLLAVPPGPMNALIASESTRSPLNGFSVGFGAMSADMVLMGITYTAYGFLKGLVHYLYPVGFIVMIYLSYSILRSTLRSSEPSGRAPLVNYAMGLVMGLSNPYQVFWWLTAGLSFMSIFGVWSVVGLFVAIFAWIVAFPWAIHRGVVLGGSRVELAVKLVSALGIIAFAIYMMLNFLWSI